MNNRSLVTRGAVVLAFLLLLGNMYHATAQTKCVISGEILKDTLRYEPHRVTKVYLSKLNEYNQFIPIDSATLEDKTFHFQKEIADDVSTPYPYLFFLTGFDNGEVPLWLESGAVRVTIPDAAFPAGASVSGTPTNDLAREYQHIKQEAIDVQMHALQRMKDEYGEEYIETSDGMKGRLRIGAEALLESTAKAVLLLLEYNDSPLAPLMFEYELAPLFSQDYNEMLVSSITPALQSHPYFISFSNSVRAQELRIGGMAPDIALPLLDGQTLRLSDYKGKFVLLDFWASWCAPCLKEIPLFKEIYDAYSTSESDFVLISYSLDSEEDKWKEAMEKYDLGQPKWVHAYDGLGWESPAAKYFGVESIPKTILIDPEGKIISMTLRGEEMVRRVKQILAGDLYYQTETPEK